MTPPSVVGDSAIGIASGEWPLPARDSPRIASCKKLGVSCKPNARKRSLTDTMYLANAIADFASGSTRVEEHKTVTSKEIFATMIEANKEMRNFTNYVMLRIVEMETALQERIVAMLASIMANKPSPS